MGLENRALMLFHNVPQPVARATFCSTFFLWRAVPRCFTLLHKVKPKKDCFIRARCPQDTRERLVEAARRHGRRKSEIVRIAVDFYLASTPVLLAR